MISIKRRTETGDPNVRAYFSHTQLTDKPEAAERGTEVASPVLSALLEVPGIGAAEVHAYHVVVMKAHAWEWSEIEPSLLILLTAFNADMPETKTEIPNAEA